MWFCCLISFGFQGINTTYAEKLVTAWIKTTKKLLEAGSSKKVRTEISEKTGISEKIILEWVNRADLFRIKGVGEKFSDRLEGSRSRYHIELSKRVPDNLYAKLTEVRG